MPVSGGGLERVCQHAHVRTTMSEELPVVREPRWQLTGEEVERAFECQCKQCMRT